MGAASLDMRPDELHVAGFSVARMTRMMSRDVRRPEDTWLNWFEGLECGQRPCDESWASELCHGHRGVCCGRSRKASGSIRRFRSWMCDPQLVVYFRRPDSKGSPSASRFLQSFDTLAPAGHRHRQVPPAPLLHGGMCDGYRLYALDLWLRWTMAHPRDG